MLFSGEELTTLFGSYLWALFRISALVSSAPILSSRSIPVKIKLGISIVLTLVIVPVIPSAPVVEPLSGDALLMTIHQILIGAAMGLALQMVFSIFIIGGQIIAYQMGLGFATMVDPQSGTRVPVISQFYVVIVTLVFFSLQGHLTLIEVLVESFNQMPIAPTGLTLDALWNLLSWAGHMYVAAVQIALPAIASIMLVNFTFGVVTRSAPQFNIFSIGFPITMIMGFFIIMSTLTSLLPHITKQISLGFELILKMVSGA